MFELIMYLLTLKSFFISRLIFNCNVYFYVLRKGLSFVELVLIIYNYVMIRCYTLLLYFVEELVLGE